MNKNAWTITGTEAKAADRYAMDVLGMASLALMETASRKVADYVIKHYPEKKTRITVLCGTGNNGADGVCAARMLLAEGYQPNVYLAGKTEKASWELLYQLFHYQQAGGTVTIYDESIALPEEDILIDGIFGIGLHREIAGIYRTLIQEANRHRHVFTLAIDAPSGINTDTGVLMGCGIAADLTITFGRNKTGLVSGEGRAYAGKVQVEDIGIPDEAYEKTTRKMHEAKTIEKLI